MTPSWNQTAFARSATAWSATAVELKPLPGWEQDPWLRRVRALG
ncbi:hypothetical protein AB0C34_26000 [Nocardia sp. NPDC049220]